LGWGRAVSCNDSSPFFFAGLTLAPANRILADGLLNRRRDVPERRKIIAQELP
jgi:hypothetical protein